MNVINKYTLIINHEFNHKSCYSRANISAKTLALSRGATQVFGGVHQAVDERKDRNEPAYPRSAGNRKDRLREIHSKNFDGRDR